MLNKNSKRGFKEKIVQIYIDLIKETKNVHINEDQFWNEFFLLKVWALKWGNGCFILCFVKANPSALEAELKKVASASKLTIIVRELFHRSLQAIGDTSNRLKVLNGLIVSFNYLYFLSFIGSVLLDALYNMSIGVTQTKTSEPPSRRVSYHYFRPKRWSYFVPSKAYWP